MILRCSRGCEFDTEHDIFRGYLRPGDRCPNELSYDVMSGSTYCRRILREVLEPVPPAVAEEDG